MKRRYLFALTALLCPLSACGDKDIPPPPPPPTYTYEADSIPALEQLITKESGGFLVDTLTNQTQAELTYASMQAEIDAMRAEAERKIAEQEKAAKEAKKAEKEAKKAAKETEESGENATPPPAEGDAVSEGEMTAEGEPAPEGEMTAEGEATEGEAAVEEVLPTVESIAEEIGAYTTYVYYHFNEGYASKLAQQYVALLRNGDNQMKVQSAIDDVDVKYEGEEPDYSQPSGELTLLRRAVQMNADGTPYTTKQMEEEAAAEAAALLAEQEAAAAEKAAAELEEAKKTMTKEEKKALKEQEKAEKKAAKEKEKEEKERAKEEEKAAKEAAENPIPPAYAECQLDPEMRLRVRIEWTPHAVNITIDKVNALDFETSMLSAGQMLSFSSARALMYTLDPLEIGLPGGTMDDYILKPGSGFVWVDETACLAMYVYQKEDGGNKLIATYFISSDAVDLYRELEPGSHQVEKIILQNIEPITVPNTGQSALKTPEE